MGEGCFRFASSLAGTNEQTEVKSIMNILVINAGSSSLKYQLIDMTTEAVLAKGLCEKIGIGGNITHKTQDGYKDEHAVDFPTHAEAFEEVVRLLTPGDHAVIKDASAIGAIGHRVVQGGTKFSASALVSEDMITAAEEFSDLAPLHNPACIAGIRACQKVFPKDIPQVAVFDTAFHQTMPEKAYIYPVPYEYYEKYSVRKYGFHGTSHRYVSARLAQLMGKPIEELKIVTCHLGNGSSIAAVDHGKSVDTTMGLTPLDGVIMGTRCGSIDPSVATYIAEKEGMTIAELNNMMNKKSGVLGVSGVSSDNRDVSAAAASGNHRAQLALDIQKYEIKKYVAAFAAAMGGVDAVLFTGGIGENDQNVRLGVCSDMEFMGIKIDPELNAKFSGQEHEISTPDSKVKVWIVPTNEELMIARDTLEIVSK